MVELPMVHPLQHLTCTFKFPSVDLFLLVPFIHSSLLDPSSSAISSLLHANGCAPRLRHYRLDVRLFRSGRTASMTACWTLG